MTSPLVCLGLGYTAHALVSATSFSPVVATNRAQSVPPPAGITTHHALDIATATTAQIQALLPAQAHVLYSIPTLKGTEQVAPVLRAYEAACAASALSFLYLSSTSVYGDHFGAWVDEDTRTNPASAMGRDRLEVEEALRAHARAATPVRVARIAGIYGPERTLVSMVRSGRLKLLPQVAQKVTNRIHRDDLVQALIAILEATTASSPAPFERYNVSDGHPVSTLRLLEWLGRHHQLPLPELGLLPDETPRGEALNVHSRRTSHNRISAQKLRQDTGWRPRYPDVFAGYEALLGTDASDNAKRAGEPE